MDHILEAEAETYGPGVLNLFPFKYPRVIKQSTRTPRSTGKAVDFTLLHHNNARSGKSYAEFSIGTRFPLVKNIKKQQYMKTQLPSKFPWQSYRESLLQMLGLEPEVEVPDP